MERKMNLIKSVKNDYGLFFTFLLPVMIIVVEVIYSVLGDEKIDINALFSLSYSVLMQTSVFRRFLLLFAAFLVCLICFIKRIAYIKSFENENKKIEAKVVDIRYVKDRCGVDVEFDLYGTKCKKHFALMNNAQTKYIHMDSDIVLIMKGENPKKVLIEELYFD